MKAFNRIMAVVAWAAQWCPPCRGDRHPDDRRTFVCYATCEVEGALQFASEQLARWNYGDDSDREAMRSDWGLDVTGGMIR